MHTATLRLSRHPRALLTAAVALLISTVGFLVTRSHAAEQTTAEEMMIRAHESRAVWKDFPGFTADVTVWNDGEKTQGQLTVTADGEVKLDLPDEKGTEWAERQLQILVDHRQPADDRQYNVSFADDVTTHPLGRKIKFHGDELHSVYRIEGDVIREVHRTMGNTRFAITVTEVTRNADKKYLPKTYTVSFWNTETDDLTRSILVHENWTTMGDFDLPVKIRRIVTGDDGTRHVRQIRLKNHRLLESAPTE